MPGLTHLQSLFGLSDNFLYLNQGKMKHTGYMLVVLVILVIKHHYKMHALGRNHGFQCSSLRMRERCIHYRALHIWHHCCLLFLFKAIYMPTKAKSKTNCFQNWNSKDLVHQREAPCLSICRFEVKLNGIVNSIDMRYRADVFKDSGGPE